MIDSYFISYFSNQSSDYFTQNKSYKFKVYLPHQTFFPSELTQKKLIVGLKSLTFQFPKNVQIGWNVQVSWKLKETNTGIYERTFSEILPAGCYALFFCCAERISSNDELY